MALYKNRLDQLRARINVDCDTLDSSVPKSLGPFVDCTSNQAIAAAELSKPGHEDLISSSVHQAKKHFPKYQAQQDVTLETLAVDILSINLQTAILPHISGYVHLQTNPYFAHDETKTTNHVHLLLSLFRTLHPDLESKRICFKLPSTHPCLRATKTLSATSIPVLATIIFHPTQAALASEAGAIYVAPYLNELRVHFEAGHVDSNPGFEAIGTMAAYLKKMGSGTRVMPASLTSTEEIEKLVSMDGVRDITISPILLRELAALPAVKREETTEGKGTEELEKVDWKGVLSDQAKWEGMFDGAYGGKCKRKLDDAILLFCEAQDRLVEIVKKELAGEK